MANKGTEAKCLRGRRGNAIKNRQIMSSRFNPTAIRGASLATRQNTYEKCIVDALRKLNEGNKK